MERRESQGGPLASITCRKVVMAAATPSPPSPDLNISGCHQRLHFRARTQDVGVPTITRPLYFLHILFFPRSRHAALLLLLLSSSHGPHQPCLSSTIQPRFSVIFVATFRFVCFPRIYICTQTIAIPLLRIC
ncbi:hypothetical protein E2C01_082527 [Portunus trituberculatus]|uniref:Uncharacterized protein n=1 Tax=Portunus trituberculatus TaxID=210409 RepID=A0A5B7J141_PORTR|nr:hypothetical protein [Portunus trituberculatus]